MNSLLIKRVYELAAIEDGFRVLVDRIWPQGVSKGHADLDEWMRDIAPTAALRTWWDHDAARMVEFAQAHRMCPALSQYVASFNARCRALRCIPLSRASFTTGGMFSSR